MLVSTWAKGKKLQGRADDTSPEIFVINLQYKFEVREVKNLKLYLGHKVYLDSWDSQGYIYFI